MCTRCYHPINPTNGMYRCSNTNKRMELEEVQASDI